MSKSTRLSNIELLRIVAMFLVLVVHADFFSLGIPTSNDMTNYPLSSFMRFFFESISICAVDIFVLISGWFGIKSNVKGFLCFVFQILFFLILLYIVFLLKGDIHFNKKNNLSCFVLLSDKHWFIKSYIVLYILSPILNIFTEKASQKQFLFIIANYFIFQTIYGWITNAATFFSDGYSPLHFVGLYLLARYTNVYHSKYTSFSKTGDLLIYIALIALIQIVAYFNLLPFFKPKMFYYTNPLVILASLYLLLFFSKIKFQNQVINTIAKSSFSVYLLHTSIHTTEIFKSQNVYIYENFDGLLCLTLFVVFLFFVFILAIFIDQIKIYIWDKLCYFYCKKCTK